MPCAARLNPRELFRAARAECVGFEIGEVADCEMF